jgi:hypothetical protein
MEDDKFCKTYNTMTFIMSTVITIWLAYLVISELS